METALTGPGGRYDCPTADKRNVRCMLHPDLDGRLNDAVGRVAKSFLLEELLARALDGPVSVADVLAPSQVSYWRSAFVVPTGGLSPSRITSRLRLPLPCGPDTRAIGLPKPVSATPPFTLTCTESTELFA